MSDTVTLSSGSLSATIQRRGAEVRALTGTNGARWLHDGKPDWWNGVAPLLFPIVGSVADDLIRVGNATYPMARHGIARTADFAVIDRGQGHVTMRLTDADTGRDSYPFAYLLDVTHRLDGERLTIEVCVCNSGTDPLPFSLGFHPAFAWPLPGGEGREHRIRFAEPEPAPIRRIDPATGLMLAATEAAPVRGAILVPTAAMFDADAMIWDSIASRSLRWGVDAGPGVTLDFPDCPMLGIWQRPGAPFVCIEPWAGHADPVGYSGDFADKPGMMRLAPGATRKISLSITVEH